MYLGFGRSTFMRVLRLIKESPEKIESEMSKLEKS